MSKRTELINAFYDGYREDLRLKKSRHGQLEYLTTMHYINKMTAANSSVLEIGAGTGRYSIALAQKGYKVTAFELADRNFDILKTNAKGINNIDCYQGDALDLSRFEDNSFDLTLVLGPMYHLFTKEDMLKALNEAVRVTKPDGIIMTAFLSIHAIMHDNYLQGNFADGFRENLTEDFKVRHFPEQFFTGFYIDEFEALFDTLHVQHITTVATDSILELAEMTKNYALSDEDFELFAKYHLHNCERVEYLGSSSHLLHICKKKQ